MSPLREPNSFSGKEWAETPFILKYFLGQMGSYQ